MTPLAKVLLAAVTLCFGALLTAGGMIHNSMAEDVDHNARQIEQLDEAVQDIRTYQAVDEAQQQVQTLLLEQMLAELKAQRTNSGE